MPTHRPPEARDPSAWELAELPRSLDLGEARAFCRAVAQRHYENFSVVSLLVPKRLRQDFANVYTFARWSDDLADESAGSQDASARLADWRLRLERCFHHEPDHPVFVALADTAARAGLTIGDFSDLLDAFEQDQRKSRYGTREELLAYCRRSANPVGRIVLALEGCRDAERLAMSDAICTGLQLVNFWQDIRRDLLAGRVYVPQDDLTRYGVAESDLAATSASPAVREMVRGLVAWADNFFDGGSPLAASAPAAVRPAIAAFLGGGRAVSAAIARAGYDPLAGRPVVGRLTKARIAASAFARACFPAGAGS